MKKIGYIDYYLDEWHANNYPRLIKEASDGRYKVCYAHAKTDAPSGMTSAQWCEKYGVDYVESETELIEKSDVIIVLAPDNPETHYELSKKALESGKPVYIDKTFSTDKATAEKIFALADANNTPCYSSSAIRFSSNYSKIDKNGIKSIHSFGAGNIKDYAVHQLDPIISLMGCDVISVMSVGNETSPSFVIEFDGDRYAYVSMMGKYFRMYVNYGDKNAVLTEAGSGDDYWPYFTAELVDFFDTGIVKETHAETVTVMAVIEAMTKSLEQPFTKIKL